MATKKTMIKWTNADLRKTFDIFNHNYFGSKLEVANLRFAPLGGKLGRTFRNRQAARRSINDTFSIHIGSQLRCCPRVAAGTLIHEMVHVEQRNRYSCGMTGKHFNVRMIELAKAGALAGLW